jgi:cysteine-rich repeat protein
MGDGRQNAARAGFWLVALSFLAGACNNPGGTTSSEEPGLSSPTDTEPLSGGTTGDGPKKISQGFSSFTPDGVVQALPQGGSAGSGGASGPPGPPYGTSTACGDAIVGADEECDDGPGAALDACTSTCQTRDQPVVPAEESLGGERFLGVGRHPLSGSDTGFALSYLQIDPLLGEPQVGVSTFDFGASRHSA